MTDKEKELRIKFNDDLEMIKIDETYEALDKLVKAVQDYLEGSETSTADAEIRMNFLKSHLEGIKEIRENNNDLKGIVELF